MFLNISLTFLHANPSLLRPKVDVFPLEHQRTDWTPSTMARRQCLLVCRTGSSEWSGRMRKVLLCPGGPLRRGGVRLPEVYPWGKLLNTDPFNWLTLSLSGNAADTLFG